VITESYFDGHFIPDQVIKWVIKFILDLQEKFPDVHTTLHCEWASSSIINNALKLAVKEQGIDVEIENAYKSTILDRVELCQILLSEKRLLFTDQVPGLKKAFSTALWDSSDKAKLKGVPIRLDNGSSDICSLDALEYSLTKYANYLMVASKITK